MAKRISRKRSLTRTALFDSVKEELAAKMGVDPADIKRTQVRDTVEAFVDVLLTNSVANRGIAIPGLGKITWRYRKARKRGIVQRFGQEFKVKARKATWIPKFRFQKAAKLTLLKSAK